MLIEQRLNIAAKRNRASGIVATTRQSVIDRLIGAGEQTRDGEQQPYENLSSEYQIFSPAKVDSSHCLSIVTDAGEESVTFPPLIISAVVGSV